MQQKCLRIYSRHLKKYTLTNNNTIKLNKMKRLIKNRDVKSKEYYIKAYDDRRERAVDEFSKENNGEKLEDIDSYKLY